MRLRFLLVAASLVGPSWVAPAQAAEPAQPRAVPLTRDEMKKALDDLKRRTPRLPLPPPSEEEKEKAGGRGFANNGRMRALYLPGNARGESSRGNDPNMSLDYTTKTMFFWVVSR